MTDSPAGLPIADMTPSAIVRHLDEYVVGQDDAKRILAVAVYSHYRKIAQAHAGGIELAKSNVLLIGSTGTGKTLLAKAVWSRRTLPYCSSSDAGPPPASPVKAISPVPQTTPR